MSTSPTPIPGPPGVPLLGNIFDIDQNNTWWSLKTLAEKYGEIFQINALGHKIVFVASAALAEEICDEKRFRKYVGGPVKEIRYLTHDGLFTAYDHEANWGIAHRIVAPQLAPNLIANHFDELTLCTDELIASWKVLGTNNTITPLTDLNRLNLEATTLTLFGKKLNCFDGSSDNILQAMEDSTSEAMRRPSRPKLLTLLLHNSKWKKAAKTQRTWAQSLIDHRAANPTPARHDLLHALLNSPDPETGTTLTPSMVIDEIVTMPIGSSTAPCALTSLIYFLLQNPSVVTRAREELASVCGDAPLSQEHLKSLPYITGIVRETLRLSHAAPGFNIEPIPKEGDTSPVLLAGGKYQIPHNQAMIIVLAGVNRDPAVFEEPLAFRPERMMGEAFEGLPRGVKKWFGNGKRECVGKHWAWEFLVVVTAKLVGEVDFEAVEGGYVMKQDGWFNVRPVGFKVKLTSIVTLFTVAFGTASAITISLPSGVSIPSGVSLPSGVTVVSAAATTTATAAAGNAANAKRQINFGSLSLRQAFGGQQTRSSSAAAATAARKA
ncbi:cytochrome P450 [Immersiella caudata]|uniref:Cytochrome P450 n=1 Tax=Immersiella caudata TaxID=314043 RepID=A0AA39WYU2_9PEZI|nr:cytochrome P450 [Immersiella caudata]